MCLKGTFRYIEILERKKTPCTYDNVSFPCYKCTLVVASYESCIHSTSTKKKKKKIGTNPVTCDDVAQLGK